MQSTSVTLLARLQEDPQFEDWDRFVQLYHPFVRRFIRLDPAMASDAEDICQEVMKKVVRKVPQFQRQRDGSFRAWLKTVTVNEVNLFWRRARGAGRLAGQDGQSVLEALQDPTHELSQMWDREHAAHILQKLQELVEPEFSDTSWAAFRMRVLEEKPTAQVAAELGISKNSVDIAKSRILGRLRREASGFLDEAH